MDTVHNSSFLEFATYPNIDWELLALAKRFYEDSDYRYCEVPYAVPVEYNLTKPHDDPSFILDAGVFQHQPHELVGSAEQGFIYQAYRKTLEYDKLCSITPCFRVERFSLQHLPWFMKLELFHLSDKQQDVDLMLNHAMNFFASHVDASRLDIVQTSETNWDITLDNIEIGSYGLRELPELTFIYGTGLALPRFNQAKDYYKVNV
jgi:hypothetical protein